MEQNSKKTKDKWMKSVTVMLPESYVAGLHELVRTNFYPNRSAVIRAAIRDMLKKKLWNRSTGDG